MRVLCGCTMKLQYTNPCGFLRVRWPETQNVTIVPVFLFVKRTTTEFLTARTNISIYSRTQIDYFNT